MKESHNRRQGGSYVERTIVWLSLSVLLGLVGIQRIVHHRLSGWVVVAMPLVVLIIYFWQTAGGADAG